MVWDVEFNSLEQVDKLEADPVGDELDEIPRHFRQIRELQRLKQCIHESECQQMIAVLISHDYCLVVIPAQVRALERTCLDCIVVQIQHKDVLASEPTKQKNVLLVARHGIRSKF